MIKLLEEHLTRYGRISDKFTDHSYKDFYVKEFEKYRNLPINLVEIGVHTGCSIALWQEYFTHPDTEIYGIDPDFAIIEDVYYKPNAHYIWDNAFSPDTLDKLKSVNFDIIIDDGSHTEQDQLACIREYLPKLKKNGVMIIEDIDPIEKLDRLANNNVPPGYQIEKIDLRHIINRIDDILLVIRYGETEKS